ncbi:uncharacterized protein N7482_001855 [Penicillium canariense]|uniref:Meiotically up-regulated gene 154 protein n=1 Tax=Penicillium canariense TaxID=189055 RepID=A0A9W9IFX7_9EURO|nr:uncharacterized protein N7482_001855 [Penicillium canariense]KAJ5175978.1 hypothetical protein N7482_001855 [Penicillium canariense]
MPRLVRRRPLAERIQSYLNPWDFLLWVSESIDGHDWDQLEKDWGLPIGIAINLVFLVARANGRSSGSKAIDDVFGDDEGVPWLSWFASFVVHLLALISGLNAIYTFHRKRRYRMFEAPIDRAPATSSANRVRVDSSPMIASPLRYLANAMSSESAESRAHPDAQRDVWELAIWDPLPISVRLFCLFSPGHVLVYMLFLPTQLSDPRPSVTIVTTVFLTILLSIQMSFISTFYTQQAKDSTLVHKEVMKEYDTKYVHPRTQPLMRDVGTQFSEESNVSSPSDAHNKVETYTPTFIINRGFKTSPNPNYVSHVDPEGISPRRPLNSTTTSTSIFQTQPSLHTPIMSRDASPMVRPVHSTMRQPQFRPASTTTGDGGSLGVYSHANSPLRKSASTAFDRRVQSNGDFFYKERGTSPLKKPSSPLKRSSLAGPMGSPVPGHRPDSLSSTSRRETGRF